MKKSRPRKSMNLVMTMISIFSRSLAAVTPLILILADHQKRGRRENMRRARRRKRRGSGSRRALKTMMRIRGSN